MRRLTGLLLSLENDHPTVDECLPGSPSGSANCATPCRATTHRGSVPTGTVSAGSTWTTPSTSAHTTRASPNTGSIGSMPTSASGSVSFPLVYEGPPGLVHGGFLGVFFDCVTQQHNCATQTGRQDAVADRQVPTADADPHRAAVRDRSLRGRRRTDLDGDVSSSASEVLCIGVVETVALPPEKLTGARVRRTPTGRGAMTWPAQRIRQPRVAEIVASRLRDDILSGRLKEGDVLPVAGEPVRRVRRQSTRAARGDPHPRDRRADLGAAGQRRRRGGAPAVGGTDRAHDRHGAAVARVDTGRRQWRADASGTDLRRDVRGPRGSD